ncbi:MAG: 50S ribosomal protein L20, partial [Bacilli bacterium]|nr:50S ribosomal protein L20 [Bacilli bacterium]
MTRVKGGSVAKNRRRKVLKKAKGYFGSKHRLYKTAQEQLFHSGAYAYRDRKQNKRNFRKLWITRINAACRINDISYSRFINGLTKAGVEINRKMLSEVAIDNPALFTSYVNIAKDALAGKVSKTEVAKANKEVAAAPKEESADISKLTVAELKEMAASR